MKDIFAFSLECANSIMHLSASGRRDVRRPLLLLFRGGMELKVVPGPHCRL